MYGPREDSELLKKYVEKLAFGRVLDMGTGSGIQVVAAAELRNVSSVLAADISAQTVAECKRTIANKNIRFVVSDLFERIPSLFDTIIFNPPYLPQQHGEDKDTARVVAGGKHGWELLGRFLSCAGNHLSSEGIMLIIFSSLTNKKKVDQLIFENGFVSELLEEMPLFFEKLYCYAVWWDPVLVPAVKKGVRNIAYLTHGRRGSIFVGRFCGKKIAIKVKLKGSEAVGMVEHEAMWLKKLGKMHVAPRFIFSGEDFLVYEFVSGEFILDYIDSHSWTAIKKILRAVLVQCFMLDRLGITKEEMHRPVKHIIISRGKPLMLDFERARTTLRPQNVTQFVHFICSLRVLFKKGFTFDVHDLREKARVYKRKPDKETFQSILYDVN